MKLAHRMGEIGTETAFEVLAKARKLEAQGRNIVHLEIGEPDFPTPPNIVEAAERALHDGYTHYTPAGGLMPARQAVADWVRRWYEVEVKPEQVVMVPGSKNVLLFTMLPVVDPGAEVTVPDHGFAVAPLPLAQKFETLMINSSSCAAAFTQMAAIEALSPRSDPSVQAMVAEFKRRRDIVVDRLNQLPGVRCHKPLGAFYVFPNITATGQNERELADRMLAEGGVALLAGSTFGEAGKGCLPHSYR